MVFRKDSRPTALYATTGYDEVWTIPSFNRSLDYHSMILKAPGKVAPYVYSSYFYDGSAKVLERSGYTNRGLNKTLATFEPNINFVKTALMPMLFAEEYYKKYPESMERIIVTNAKDLALNSKEFVRLSSTLSIVQDHKAWFEGRYKFPWFMSEYGDVVLSHQVLNELNFLYLDALHGHYPLVHNSPFMKECGYYYEENSKESALDAMHKAIMEHDNPENTKLYNIRADACEFKWSSLNPANLAEVERLLKLLLAKPFKSFKTETKQEVSTKLS